MTTSPLGFRMSVAIFASIQLGAMPMELVNIEIIFRALELYLVAIFLHLLEKEWPRHFAQGDKESGQDGEKKYPYRSYPPLVVLFLLGKCSGNFDLVSAISFRQG